MLIARATPQPRLTQPSPPPSLHQLSWLTLLFHGDFATTVSHCASNGIHVGCSSLPWGRRLFFLTQPEMVAAVTVEQAGFFTARQDEDSGGAGIVDAVGEDWVKRRSRLQALQTPSALEAVVAPAVQRHMSSLPEAMLYLPPSDLLTHCRRFTQLVMHDIIFSSQPDESTLPSLSSNFRATAAGTRRRRLLLRLARLRLAASQLRAFLMGKRMSFFELAGFFTNRPRKVQRFAAIMAASLPLPLSGTPSAAAAASLLGSARLSHAAWVEAQVLRRSQQEGGGGQSQGEEGVRADVLGWLLTQPSRDQSSEMSAASATPVIHDLISAGSDTTAAAIASTLLLLSEAPKVQAKAFAEAMNFTATPVDNSTRLDVRKAVAHLRYCRACVMEALRLYPAASLVMRVANSDADVCGVRIPRGSAVITSPETLGRNPEHWENADQFQPERFLGGLPPRTGTYLPFGAGPRACLGKQASLLIATLAIAHVILDSAEHQDISCQQLV